ncbi:hypothetical protein L218DRAFT_964806 [Marasmius fiardii PR-910]|nr:hypothetical protein L218DRAFT_964806 [Marasmius fiardii PR-910]
MSTGVISNFRLTEGQYRERSRGRLGYLKTCEHTCPHPLPPLNAEPRACYTFPYLGPGKYTHAVTNHQRETRKGRHPACGEGCPCYQKETTCRTATFYEAVRAMIIWLPISNNPDCSGALKKWMEWRPWPEEWDALADALFEVPYASPSSLPPVLRSPFSNGGIGPSNIGERWKDTLYLAQFPDLPLPGMPEVLFDVLAAEQGRPAQPHLIPEAPTQHRPHHQPTQIPMFPSRSSDEEGDDLPDYQPIPSIKIRFVSPIILPHTFTSPTAYATAHEHTHQGIIEACPENTDSDSDNSDETNLLRRAKRPRQIQWVSESGEGSNLGQPVQHDTFIGGSLPSRLRRRRQPTQPPDSPSVKSDSSTSPLAPTSHSPPIVDPSSHSTAPTAPVEGSSIPPSSPPLDYNQPVVNSFIVGPGQHIMISSTSEESFGIPSASPPLDYNPPAVPYPIVDPSQHNISPSPPPLHYDLPAVPSPIVDPSQHSISPSPPPLHYNLTAATSPIADPCQHSMAITTSEGSSNISTPSPSLHHNPLTVTSPTIPIPTAGSHLKPRVFWSPSTTNGLHNDPIYVPPSENRLKAAKSVILGNGGNWSLGEPSLYWHVRETDFKENERGKQWVNLINNNSVLSRYAHAEVLADDYSKVILREEEWVECAFYMHQFGCEMSFVEHKVLYDQIRSMSGQYWQAILEKPKETILVIVNDYVYDTDQEKHIDLEYRHGLHELQHRYGVRVFPDIELHEAVIDYSPQLLDPHLKDKGEIFVYFVNGDCMQAIHTYDKPSNYCGSDLDNDGKTTYLNFGNALGMLRPLDKIKPGKWNPWDPLDHRGWLATDVPLDLEGYNQVLNFATERYNYLVAVESQHHPDIEHSRPTSRVFNIHCRIDVGLAWEKGEYQFVVSKIHSGMPGLFRLRPESGPFIPIAVARTLIEWANE